MSKKESLLSEAQVRKFMKLANLTPITPGFVGGMGESHGRGRGEGAAGYGHPDDSRPGARLREDESEDGGDVGDELEEGSMSYREDEEPLEEPLPDEEPLEEPLGDEGEAGGREVSVDDFLAALEVALEEVLGDEVSVEEEEPAEEPLEDEEPVGDLGVEPVGDLGVEPGEELALQEMINKITKRVAKRIVQEALQGKKKKSEEPLAELGLSGMVRKLPGLKSGVYKKIEANQKRNAMSLGQSPNFGGATPEQKLELAKNIIARQAGIGLGTGEESGLKPGEADTLAQQLVAMVSGAAGRKYTGF